MTIKNDRLTKASTVEVGKPVMIRCQATHGCNGSHATIVSSFNLEGEFGYAGRRTRYQCETCGKVFVIRH